MIFYVQTAIFCVVNVLNDLMLLFAATYRPVRVTSPELPCTC